jgi:glutathione synthase/RimK-type ligase-like ATP-grasp enzyme
MDRASVVKNLRPVKHALGDRYRKWALDRNIPSFPAEVLVSVGEARDVLLLCSQWAPRFDPKTYLQELAFAHEMAARSRPFATSKDPSILFDRSIVWFLPNDLVSPPLWDYSRQAYEFALGLERQGNGLFCSSHETRYWENKAHMHQEFDAIGLPTPKTKLLTAESWRSVDFDFEPVLIKEEHSAGSAGVHYSPTATDARRFVEEYTFRLGETLIVQEVVRGATKDLRLTMVGDRMIGSATFWRRKNPEVIATGGWTTTASKYGSLVEHEDIPESVVPLAAECLRKLGIRTAGIDLIWVDDDLSTTPLFLELSPYYQPNPPKPKRYEDWTYKQYKEKPYVKEGYLPQQYLVFREMAAEMLDQGLY